MPATLRDLPADAWRRVLWLSAAIVGGSTLLSVGITIYIMSVFSAGVNEAGLATAIAAPLLIGGPMTLMHLLRLAQLKLANQKLQILASTDWLTSCLNRRAFASHVAGQLDAAGAFLVIDADHFKVINDRFGHDRGDEVLQLMAASIRANVRDNDVVGRIGGEEFGVFLEGADAETARRVAERIRSAIQALDYAPDGRRQPLSVSVGGACYNGNISFSELFRIADQRLYGVKQSGRNRVDVAHAAPVIGLAIPA
jgi:diguanylate cyclase